MHTIVSTAHVCAAHSGTHASHHGHYPYSCTKRPRHHISHKPRGQPHVRTTPERRATCANLGQQPGDATRFAARLTPASRRQQPDAPCYRSQVQRPGPLALLLHPLPLRWCGALPHTHRSDDAHRLGPAAQRRHRVSVSAIIRRGQRSEDRFAGVPQEQRRTARPASEAGGWRSAGE